MDGGIFACPDGLEFLLPEGVAHLRDMGAVCVHRWRLLGLTPTGCRILAGERVEAELLLAPGDCSLAGFSAGTVVTYGLSPRDSITLSSLTEPVLCIQRQLPRPDGGHVEPQEFLLPVLPGPAEVLLPLLGVRLLQIPLDRDPFAW